MTYILLYSAKMFLGYVVVHLLISQFASEKFFLKKSALIWIFYVCFSQSIVPPPPETTPLPLLFFSVSIWGLYILVLVAARNSLTLRMMDEIDRARALSSKELLTRFPEKDGIGARLASMEQNGILTFDADKTIRLTTKGDRLGRLMIAVQKIFSIRNAV